MDNATIARTLAEVADLLEIEGANPFRIRAYRNAVRSIETQTTQLAQWCDLGRELTSLPGIGKEMARHVEELCATGTLGFRDELAAQVPAGLITIMRLPGVGPKKARRLWEELEVTGVDELEAAAAAGKVRGVAGFGVRSEEKILAGIAEWRQHASRLRLDQVERHVEPLLTYLRGTAGGEAGSEAAAGRVEVAGSYRRRRDTVGDVDLLATAETPQAAAALTARFLAYPQVADTLMSGGTRTSVRLGSGLQVDLRVVPPESFGAALVYFTGSKEHNVRLRQRALALGLTVSEYGVFRLADEPAAEVPGDGAAGDRVAGERIAGASEEEVYAALGCAWIPPELREDRGELAAAARGELPRLVEVGDLAGDLQMHSTWSDGRASVEEMLVACAERGYRYMALTDHSKALPMVGGLGREELLAQWEEIDEVQARHPEIRLLRSLEIDILADGSLDLDDDLLARLDVVLVSVHSRFELPSGEQTARILAAVRHPEVNVLAHPLGRRIGHRKPMEYDVEAVLHACRAHGVAVECNASPERLDFPDIHLARARELGVPVVISTDAHSPRGLATMRYGVDQARRAGLEPHHVLNTRPLEEVLRFFAKTDPPAGGSAV
ncbi:MAG TPA: DNA polymerase/3'-5' exonuclease PolX [Thermoanaerobaculia bacterium]|nr:DNA polymerase/3'-5' exonuclease PolX [Thermoanaerobaculia bacterium]